MTVPDTFRLPPKPILAIAVGVTGHRLYRSTAPGSERIPSFDPLKVRETVDRVLEQIRSAVFDIRESYRDLFADADPVITVVSALGDGADRIVAEAALACGMQLDVVLPCPRLEYERTFEDDASRAEFGALLARARACLILPMPPLLTKSTTESARHEATLDLAYEIGGLTVLGQADILLAIWDQRPARGRGGTGAIVDEAARQGTPIIILDPAEDVPLLRWYASRQFPISAQHAADLPAADVEAGLGPLIRELIAPPDPDDEVDGLLEYYKFAIAPPRGSPVAPAVSQGTANERVAARINDVFEASDEVAKQCAMSFRRTYRRNFVLGFLAVFAVTASIILPMVLPAGPKWREFSHVASATLAAAEIVCVLWIMIAAYVADRREWHRRWAEAREVAERLRVAEPFWMMGVWPHNLAAYQPAWTGWYTRAILREQPVYSTPDVINVRDAKRVLLEKIEEQVRYYNDTKLRMMKRDRVLKKSGRILIGLSLLVATVEVVSAFLHAEIDGWLRALMLSISILLPALATTFFGIRLVDDTEDIARRAARSSEILEALQNCLKDDLDDLQILRARARSASSAMLADVASWRIALQSRAIPDG